jgi:prevent-host-death family protein
MKQINIQAAKTHLSRIVEQVVNGEEIVLAKAGKPMVRMIPYQAAKKSRVGGQLKGQIWESPDCWAPDEHMIKQMTDSPLYHETLPKPPPLAAENQT